MYAQLLRVEGFSPFEFDDADRAFAFSLTVPPNLVITDAVLADRDGLDLARQLRRDDRTKAIPIIVVSGRAIGEADATAAAAAGADAFLVKPCPPHALVDEARRLLAVSRELRLRSGRHSKRSASARLRSTDLIEKARRIEHRLRRHS